MNYQKVKQQTWLARSAIILALVLLLTPLTVSAQEQETRTTKLFTVITSEEAETQFMALILSLQSVRQGAEVRILLCGEAGKLAIRDLTFAPLKPADRSPRDLLEELLRHEVRVDVCAIFLPNRDYVQDDLIPGVGTAMPGEVAEYMLQTEVRLFTF